MTIAQRTSAASLISRKGQTVAIAGTASATYNPATGSTTPTSYSKSAKAVLLPMTPFKQWAGTEIKAGDENLLLAGLDTSGAALTEPPVNAIVTMADSSKRTLVAIARLDPDGAGSILYDCAVRGYA